MLLAQGAAVRYVVLVRILVSLLIASSAIWNAGIGAHAAVNGVKQSIGAKQYPTVFECYTFCRPHSIGIQPFTNFDLEGTWTLNNVGIWLFMDDPNHTNSNWYCPCYAGPSTAFADYYGNSAGTVSPPAAASGSQCLSATYDPTQTWAANFCASGYVQSLAYEGLPAGTASTAFTIFGTCYCAQGYLNYSPPDTFGFSPASPARSVAAFGNWAPRGAQIMYGQGRTFPLFDAPYSPFIVSPQYDWGTSDIARQIAMCDGQHGYELDGYGGLHPLGTSPPITRYPSWSTDIARGLVLRSDCQSGYVLDGFGGIHPFASSSVAMPPTPRNDSYWPGWDIAHSFDYIGSVNGADSGYLLDGYGGIHPWGNAPAATNYSYWGWDIARAMVTSDNGTSGYVLDGWGGVHPYGNAPIVTQSAYWSGHDIFRGLAMIPFNNGGYYVDSSTGHLQTFHY